MGVAGSGKSTLGAALAKELGWDFFEADDFHSAENVAKMTAGIPLTDSDRGPWLAALNRQLLSSLQADRRFVLACSALKEKYRSQLFDSVENAAIIYLKGSRELLRLRLSARQGHFMRPQMLQSQLEALEEPQNALILDVSMSLDDMLDTIMSKYLTQERSSKSWD